MDTPIKDKGAVGIINMGNTCFASAVFQAIRAIPQLSAYILKKNMEEECTNIESKEGTIILAYKDLIKTMFGGSLGDVCRPEGFYESLRKVVKGTIYEQFSQRLPNDAHEFTVYLLDQFHEALKRPFILSCKTNLIDAQKGWYESFKNSYSPLVDLLFGLECIKSICHKCKTVSPRWEVFNMLKIGVKDVVGEMSINNMIEHELKHIETIEGYQCDTCNERTTVDRHRTIWKLPHILIVVIRRFNEMGTKEHTAVNTSLTLTPSKIFDADSPELSRNYTYGLISTIHHHGSHFGGHYTAAAINPINAEWYFYDDEHVTKADPQKFSQFENNMYIAIYRKI